MLDRIKQQMFADTPVNPYRAISYQPLTGMFYFEDSTGEKVRFDTLDEAMAYRDEPARLKRAEWVRRNKRRSSTT
jgi:hypothetical protein